MLGMTARMILGRPLPDHGMSRQLSRSCQTRPELAYGVLSLDFTHYKRKTRSWRVSSVQILQKTHFTSKTSKSSVLPVTPQF